MALKRIVWLVVVAVACSYTLSSLFLWWKRPIRAAVLPIPASLRGEIPEGCQQLIAVRPDAVDGFSAEVWLLERGPVVSLWKIVAGPLPAVVGKNGTGWGLGEPALPNPGGYPDKQEGDGRSPAGIFRLPGAFGTAAQAPAGVKLPWLECTPTLRGVDDAKSKYYNQIVDEATVPDKDWDSAEVMRRDDGAYEMGLLIDHNADHLAGAGSCIFLHLWKGPGQGTAGCTALAREDVLEILQWLDPAREPRLVLGVP